MKRPITLIGIPTRDRPEYLCALLSTIMFQSRQEFDVVVVDTSDYPHMLKQNPHLQRLMKTFEANGHKFTLEHVEVAGRSEAAAVNRILLKAQLEGYEYVYKIDDDHVLPPNGLSELHTALEFAESQCEGPHLVSAVTPWMHQAFEGAASPDDPVLSWHVSLRPPVTDIWLANANREEVIKRGWRHEISLRHFGKYSGPSGMVQTKLASAANFLMRPDTRLLWSDVGQSSLFADAIWFLQLQHFIGYALWFVPTVWAWHVAAPSGGVRETKDEHDKFSEWDMARRKQLDLLLERFGELGDKGLKDAPKIERSSR